ncbi:MAG: DUF6285 domain-containing protein [Acidiferrobacterales bacterium]
MPDRPVGAELLVVARETLLKELLPEITDECRYSALMVANAIGIAAREAKDGKAVAELELQMFTELYGASCVGTNKTTARQLAALEARLARDIRAGRFDGKTGERLREMLFAHVQARLRISNPKYLKGAGLSDE